MMRWRELTKIRRLWTETRLGVGWVVGRLRLGVVVQDIWLFCFSVCSLSWRRLFV